VFEAGEASPVTGPTGTNVNNLRVVLVNGDRREHETGTRDEASVVKDPATTVMERCDLLANISEEPRLIYRPYGSRAMRGVNHIVAGWMLAAGMTTRRDEIGNLIGRYEGDGDETIVLGSHLDTVRDAGKYDGILGVMVAIACVQQLRDRGERLPYAIEVVGFDSR